MTPDIRRRRRAAALGLATVAVAAICAGCGSPASSAGGASHPHGPAAASVSLPLVTSASTAQATWAVLPMGAQSGPNEFWQLFLLPAGASRWSLATPPDVATNGAIALAGLSGHALVIGIHPSLYLTYSPVSDSDNAGYTWTSAQPAPGLASVPDSLAATPGGTDMLSLDRAGQAQSGRASGTAWSTVATAASLAATPAGRACGLDSLTAVAFTQEGTPLLGGNCTHPGVAGIFARTSPDGGAWVATGPALPGALSGQPVRVLRLTDTGQQQVVVLQAGTGAAATLLAAWRSGTGPWTSSPSLSLAGASVLSSSFGSDGAVAVVLSSGRGAVVTAPRDQWQRTPPVPAGQGVTLAQPPGGGLQALTTQGGEFTAWRLPPGATAWTKAQTMSVPIQYGSSN